MKQKNGVNITWMMLALSSLLLTAACVTVNVNFPEGAVQKAATDYVNELYKAKQEEENTTDSSSSGYYVTPTNSLVALFIPAAHAVDFHMDSAKVKTIQSKQKGRIGKILKFKKMGAIGETDKGTLEVKDAAKVKSKVDQLKMKKLVSSENSDRAALYKEIIASNSLTGDMEGGIRKIFFQKFRDADPAGSFYKEGGAWKSK